MASVSTTMNPPILDRPNAISICLKEAKYEFLKSVRFPMFLVATLVFPLMFYVLFGLVMGKAMIGNLRSAVYLMAAYGTFGVMGASLFSTAASLASERGLGWLEVKRASPMPPFAYFLAKVLMGVIFSAIDVLALMILGVAFGGVHLPAAILVKLALTLIAGSLPFCAMGLAIGYLARPTSAPAVINLFHLPMSFCSGLWMPFMFLPNFIQRVGVFLPSYHLSQLALNLVGGGQGGTALGHWQTLIGFALLCLGVARLGHQRDQRAQA
jgi:ABC-2 type transport system permease protein